MLRVPNKAAAAYARQAGGFADLVDQIAAALAGDGVLTGMGVAAQGSPDMTVAVAAGQTRIGGYPAAYAGGNVTIAAADSTNARFDLIVCDYNGTVSRVAGTASAYPVPPDLPANSIQLAQVTVLAGATSIANDKIIDKRPLIVDYFDLYDEFLSAALATTGNISGAAWGTTASGTAANAFQAGEDKHPGILRLVTGATSGNNSRIHLGASATAVAPFLPANLGRHRFIVRIPTITSIAVKIGVGVNMSDAAAGSLGSAGAWIEFVPATSAKWRYGTRQASASTMNADTGADVAANTWYQFDVFRRQDGAVQFLKNGLLAFTHSSNQPTTACTMGALVHTLTAAARSLDIDAIGMNFAPLGARWT